MVTTRSDRIKAGPPTQTRRQVVEIVEEGIEIITPVFGGGVTAKGAERRPDEVTPVRGTSVRGQLRFWWRALYGARYQTVTKLREAEGRLWGLASEPGLATISIESRLAAPSAYRIFELVNGKCKTVTGKEAIAYGAFPLQPEKRAPPGTEPGTAFSVLGTFSVQVALAKADDSLREEVASSLRCWRCFGGIGGRTRRGFGALSAPPAFAQLTSAQLLTELAAVTSPHIVGVPAIFGAEAAFGRAAPADAAWGSALGALRDFRQGRGIARTPRPNQPTPGQSRWPEPDVVRRATNMASSGHEPRNPIRDVAPRATFGLPIILHFKDENAGDPHDSTIALEAHERYASPLVVRPFGTRANCRPMALLLGNRPSVTDVIVTRKGSKTNERDVVARPRARLTAAEVAALDPSLRAHFVDGDAVRAFMNFFQTQVSK